MAGTPTGTPAGDSPAGQRGDENGLGWQRPVPQRWSPSAEPTAVGVTPDPAQMKPYSTPVPLTPQPNAAVPPPEPSAHA